MHVKTRPPADVEIVLSMSREEIEAFYQATRQGRRSRAQVRLLEEFGNMVVRAVFPDEVDRTPDA